MTEMNETTPFTVLPGQESYVAPLDETPLKAVDSMDESAPASSMWADAWRTLRKNPLFIISGLLIIFIVFVALFPSVLTKQNPNYCTLDNSLDPASAGHPFGFDLQGCDVYSRVVYGTRTSLSVGVFATLLVVLLGTLIGAIAGFFGGWVDAVLSHQFGNYCRDLFRADLRYVFPRMGKDVPDFSSGPVSYTHLDVYKRQECLTPSLPAFCPDRFPFQDDACLSVGRRL